VTAIVARHGSVKHAAWIGASWGIGHTLTILMVGGAIILFGWVIPPRIGLSMELSVGLMLILLGVLNLTSIVQWMNTAFSCGPLRGENHSHSHADDLMAHPHDPEHTSVNWFDRHFGRIGFYQVVRPLIVGIVHGLAGSAAVALMVLTTIRDSRWAIVYLLVFGVGTIAGMMLITMAVGLTFSRASRSSLLNQGFRVASGLISLAFGVFLAYKFGLAKGLFTSHPNWIPG
jgi:high-affinity nickel-transport protein